MEATECEFVDAYGGVKGGWFRGVLAIFLFFGLLLFFFVLPAENRDAEMHVELHSMVLNKERASHTLLYLGNLILFPNHLSELQLHCMGFPPIQQCNTVRFTVYNTGPCGGSKL